MGKRDQVILKNEGICKGFFCEKWTSNPENQEVEIEELMKLSLEFKKNLPKLQYYQGNILCTSIQYI